MIRILLACLALAGLATMTQAACEGRDLRPTLTASERQALAQAVDATPYPAGNRWRATRGDDVVEILGTVHLDDPRLAGPADRLRPLVRDAGVVLLEMTETERTDLMRAMQSDPTLLVLDDTTLPELMEEDDWLRLSEAARARGLPPFMVARFRPWYVAMLLSFPPCLKAELAEQNGFDTQIEAMAREAGTPLRALEPYDTAFRAFDSVPRVAQLDMMLTSLTDAGTSEDQLATLLSAYFDEDHAAGWIVNEILAPRTGVLEGEAAEAAFATLTEALLDARNRAWIPRIEEAAAATDAPILAAFGAAHLHGEAGVLNLLDDAGWTLERQKF